MKIMAIGMPSIDIIFKKLAATLIQRSTRGIVALIVKDDTLGATPVLNEYSSSLAVEATKFTATNVQYIKDVLTGGAAKVYVASVPTTSTTVVADAIAAIGSRKYNWIGLAEGTATEQADLVAYVKEQEVAKKSIKAVVYKATAPDSQHIVNFTNDSIAYKDGTTLTGEKFVARLLGVLAGLPLTRSATYYAFADVASVVEPTDLNTAIGNGEFVLFNDDDVVRVARAVNSLTTLSPTVSEDFKKIIVVETIDQIRDDISTVFKNDYLGKYKNRYDNQVLFISAVNGYFASLAVDEILDSASDNRADVDVETQRAAWIASGKTEAADWDEQTVKNMSFGSNVYLSSSIRIPDVMEDLQFSVSLQ